MMEKILYGLAIQITLRAFLLAWLVS